MKSNTNFTKTTGSKRKPETTIIATIEITKIVDDQMIFSDEAEQLIEDIIEGIDADRVEIKKVKHFEIVEG